MTFIETKEQKGSRSAKRLKKLKINIDQPLAAILTINTVAHTFGAAGVGAQAVRVFGEAYFGIISAILTLLILIVSEIIPKTIGARYWQRLAIPFVNVLEGMIIISYPLVWLSKWITRWFSGRRSPHVISREEVAAMAQLGMKEGVFEESEEKIINNLLKLRTIKIKRIMTPRTVLLAAPEDLTMKTFFSKKEYLKYSRIPVYSGNIDKISGYVLKYDVLENLARDKFSKQLKEIRRDILVAYENLTIPVLFERLIEAREHIALIVDEYGGVEGIATLEDIFETLLGLEIIDETDSQADMQMLARKRWQSRLKSMGLRQDETGLINDTNK